MSSHLTVKATGLPGGLVLVELNGGELAHFVVSAEHARLIASALKRATKEQSTWIAGVTDRHSDPEFMGPMQPR